MLFSYERGRSREALLNLPTVYGDINRLNSVVPWPRIARLTKTDGYDA